MTLVTTEHATGCADTDPCQAPGCTSCAAIRFVSVDNDLEGKPRSSTARCKLHAVEYRQQLLAGVVTITVHPKAAAPLPTPAPGPVAPRRVVKFFIPPNAPAGICKACRKTIAWIQPKGRLMPVDPSGEPHWATCSDPDRFRTRDR